jgi:glycine dehydrogenase subunit 2
MRSIAAEAETNPELVKTAPHNTRIGRLDEVTAARKPILRWRPMTAVAPVPDAPSDPNAPTSRSSE